MKPKAAFILTMCFLCILSCKTNQNKHEEPAQINSIENGLQPKIIIVGDPVQHYNIYERMKHYKVSGVSIAFIDGGKIEWAKGYGYTSFDSLVPVDNSTLFQAASISKPVAALAALSLVEEGKIGLDDDVNNYLKGWQVEENNYTSDEKVTLRRLLSHSAGLTVHGFAGYSESDSVPTIIQILNGESPSNSTKIFPNVEPGKMYRYSGGGYTVMQKMLEDVTGKSFTEILDERVILKVGMNNSSFLQPLPLENAENAAIGHRMSGAKLIGNWHIYPEMAAAGLWTTSSDLLNYAIEVQKSLEGNSNKVISQKMTHEMLSVQAGSHGLGPALNGEGEALRFSHGGGNEGYRCTLMAFAKLGQGVAIMTNSDNGGDLINEILRAFSEVYNWSFHKPDKKVLYKENLNKLTDFSGKFKWTRDSLVMEFVAKNDHLMGIQHWNNDTFRIFAESEMTFFNKADGAAFEFKKDDEGIINEILIQEQYRFIRMN